MTALTRWDETKRAIATLTVERLPEVPSLLRKAGAVRDYLKAAGEVPGELKKIDVWGLRLQRRAGELLREAPKNAGGRPSKTPDSLSAVSVPTLKELGVEEKDSERWQKIAAIPEERFEEYVATEGEVSTAGALRVLKETRAEDTGDEWYTPRWLFDALGLRYSIDVCAPVDLTHVTTPADRFFAPADDGLAQKWTGTIWCNPPYSDPEPWALRCVEHGDGLLLSHVPMNAAWCARVWETCYGLRLFQGIEFVRPDGTAQRPGIWLQLAAWGDAAVAALAQLVTPPDVAANPRRVPSPMWVRA